MLCIAGSNVFSPHLAVVMPPKTNLYPIDYVLHWTTSEMECHDPHVSSYLWEQLCRRGSICTFQRDASQALLKQPYTVIPLTNLGQMLGFCVVTYVESK
jgi:hypothetical protein